MNSIQRSQPDSIFNPGQARFNAVLHNIEASANNSAVAAQSAQAISNALAISARGMTQIAASSEQTARNTADTAINTSRMVYEQRLANTMQAVALRFGQLQTDLASEANQELRQIDAAIGQLSRSVTQIGTAVDETLRKTNDVLNRSLDVQTQLLQAMQAENFRKERDRAAKRAIYLLERTCESVRTESDAVVRLAALREVTKRSQADELQADDIFEVADKRSFDAIRQRVATLIAEASDADKKALADFDRMCMEYYATLAIDPANGFPKPKAMEQLSAEMSDDVAPLPPLAGDSVMTEELAQLLITTISAIALKSGRNVLFRRVVVAIAVVFAVVSVCLITINAAIGIMFGVLVAITAWLMLGTPAGPKIAGAMTDTDIDLSREQKILTDLTLTKERATQCISEWSRYVKAVQRHADQRRQSTDRTRQQNNAVRARNVAATAFNAELNRSIQASGKMLASKRREHRQAIEIFLARHPALRQWYQLPSDAES